jgi:metal-responsive CopG/Arc/MetJ family transcriptional regulator
MAAGRFIGAHVSYDVYEAFEQARADHGISRRSEAIRDALIFWLDHNPPHGGLPEAVAELVVAVDKSKAVRDALDAAIAEYRRSYSVAILEKIHKVRFEVGGYKIPKDIDDDIDRLVLGKKKKRGKS